MDKAQSLFSGKRDPRVRRGRAAPEEAYLGGVLVGILRLFGVLGAPPWWPPLLACSSCAAELLATSSAESWVFSVKVAQAALTVAFALSALPLASAIRSVFGEATRLQQAVGVRVGSPRRLYTWMACWCVCSVVVFSMVYEYLMPVTTYWWITGVTRFIKYIPHDLFLVLHLALVDVLRGRLRLLGRSLGGSPRRRVFLCRLQGRFLRRVMPRVSAAWGPPILVLHLTVLANLLADVYSTYHFRNHRMLLTLVRTSVGAAVLVGLSYSGGQLEKECKVMKRTIFRQTTPRLNSELMYQDDWPTSISCLGLFDMNMSSLATISTVMVEYGIVMTQYSLQ